MTAAALAALVEPLAVRDPSIRPEGLDWSFTGANYEPRWWDHAQPLRVEVAADRWIASMVRWLIAHDETSWLPQHYASRILAGILLHALAAAVKAVLDERDAATKQEAKG